MSKRLIKLVLALWGRTSPGDRVWIGFFGLWLTLLTGALSSWTGGPGLIQWWRISELAQTRQETIVQLETRILELSTEQVRLEKSPVAQRREIRKVLGYLASDEILFDFSAEPIQPSLAHRN
jgi:hypothetical protein